MGLTQYTWNTRNRKGLNHCQCIDCPFDSLGAGAGVKMRAHCEAKNHGIATEYQGPIAEYIANVNGDGVKSVIITLGYLCWNTRDISVEGVLALIEEAKRLITLGNHPLICVIDNGSTDGTYEAVMKALPVVPDYFFIVQLKENRGISYARNFILNFAKEQGSQYTLLMDGDIEVVPLSTYTMIRYLHSHPDVGVIGAYSANYSILREECATSCVEIPESRVRSDIPCAWTQYGMFRTVLWDRGIRFDDSGPFGQPGWGFEDDDLHYQIVEAGYKNRYFGGMRYLHRAIHSSWDHIEAEGFNVDAQFYLRQDYLIRKWLKRGVDPGILKRVGAQKLPRFK